MHKLLLSNTWIRYLKLTKYVYGSEYSSIYMNTSNCASILDMSESAEIYPEYGKTCLDLSIVLNMAEYVWNITCLNKPGI